MKTKYTNVFINPTAEEVMGAHRTPIAFDLDSVMNEMGHSFGHALADHFNLDFDTVRAIADEGFERFHFEVPGASYKETADVINRTIMTESPSALATPFMSEVTDFVHHVTLQPIAVVTARHPMTVGVTKRWLEQNLNVPFRAYIINGEPKSKVLSFLDAQIFVDDRHKTVRNLIGQIPQPVMYKRPWNQNRPTILPVTEVNDLRDIIPMLNILIGRAPMDWPYWIPYPKPNGERATKKYATIV